MFLVYLQRAFLQYLLLYVDKIEAYSCRTDWALSFVSFHSRLFGVIGVIRTDSDLYELISYWTDNNTVLSIWKDYARPARPSYITIVGVHATLQIFMQNTTYSICYSHSVSQHSDISRRAKRERFRKRTGDNGRSEMACEACNAKFNLFKRKVSGYSHRGHLALLLRCTTGIPRAIQQFDKPWQVMPVRTMNSSLLQIVMLMSP